MSESLRNDGRVWVPRAKGDKRGPSSIPDAERYYFLEERYPRFGNLVPRDVAARQLPARCECRAAIPRRTAPPAEYRESGGGTG